MVYISENESFARELGTIRPTLEHAKQTKSSIANAEEIGCILDGTTDNSDIILNTEFTGLYGGGGGYSISK